MAQEKQQALLLLQGKDNCIVLKWGPASVDWPDPVRLKEALSGYTGATYEALLDNLPDDGTSQQVRGLIRLFLRLLKEDELMDEMELLEGRANKQQDLTPLLQQMRLNSHLDAAAESPVVERLQSQKEEVLRLCAEIDVLLSTLLLAKLENKRTL